VDDLPGDRAAARARRGRFHVYRDALRGGWRAGRVGWADQPEPPDDGRPVIELFATAAFPAGCGCTAISLQPGLRLLRSRVLTTSPATLAGLERFRALLDEALEEGFREDFAVRPLVRRGLAAPRPTGIDVDDALLAPELTISADGVHWHPIGGDGGSSPDLLGAEGAIPLGQAKQRIVECFLTLRQADGTLPAAFLGRMRSARPNPRLERP